MKAPAPAQRIRLLSPRGWLRVFVCPLCGCLVPLSAEERHSTLHRLDFRRGREE